jgi:hypothetical protein
VPRQFECQSARLTITPFDELSVPLVQNPATLRYHARLQRVRLGSTPPRTETVGATLIAIWKRSTS